MDIQTLRTAQAMPRRPEWVLVQDNHDGRASSLAPDYTLIGARFFGPHRQLMLWRLRSAQPPS
jgi:hypothetical protein